MSTTNTLNTTLTMNDSNKLHDDAADRDVTLIADCYAFDVSFKILQSRSPVLAEKLSNPLTTTLALPHDPYAVKLFLDYLYTDEYSTGAMKASDLAILHVKVFVLAITYDVKDLASDVPSFFIEALESVPKSMLPAVERAVYKMTPPCRSALRDIIDAHARKHRVVLPMGGKHETDPDNFSACRVCRRVHTIPRGRTLRRWGSLEVVHPIYEDAAE